MLVVVSVGFFALGVDDLLVDICYAVRRLYRRLFVERRYKSLSESDLLEKSEQPVAIMIPTWQESGVIRQMLENTLRTVTYSDFEIFVGTYQNDEETAAAVEKAREQSHRVHRIVCPKDGPTSKADCLNWIYQGIRSFEARNSVKFAFYVMHDSEDIVHPLSLKLFNYLMPRMGMVQLPVLPLQTRLRDFTSGHYIDEFCEFHSKNLVVREFLSHTMPCAGVGCAFSREVFETFVEADPDNLFNVESLTEDYEFGLRLRDYSWKAIFVNKALKRTVVETDPNSGEERRSKVSDYVATRELFPNKLSAAVRQKSRWVIGIALQGWRNLGWRGTWAARYAFLQDRKCLLGNHLNMAGYAPLGCLLLLWIPTVVDPGRYSFPVLVTTGSWLWYILWVDLVFLLNRLVHRSFFVWRIYGWKQGLCSIPRAIWGNVINFLAVVRAVYLYGRYLLTRKPIGWDKTGHVFPSALTFSKTYGRLGDLLLEQRSITVDHLLAALQVQRQRRLPLGLILKDLRYVEERHLQRALTRQIESATPLPPPKRLVSDLLRKLPRDMASSCSAIPVDEDQEGRVVIATSEILSREKIEALQARFDKPIRIQLAERKEVGLLIERAYGS